MTEQPMHMCVGPSCWTCGEPSELRDLRQNSVMPALYALRQQRPGADHHAQAEAAMAALRPTLMRWLEAENLLRDVLAHVDGVWSPERGLAEIAARIRAHQQVGGPVIEGLLLAVPVAVLGAFLAAARAGSRSDQAGAAADEAARQRSHDIAYRIRAELVCCHIYDRVQRGELTEEQQTEARTGRHALCYWGEASAQLAEGRCPGRETAPNICQCPCSGCRSSCSAHVDSEEPQP